MFVEINQIICGDCRTIMATMPEKSIDAIVTDPPYGLNFMGKEWDHGIPGTQFWQEALRVCKPGAHMLAFGGTRTHHRLMVAIEDAGWEIRDCLGWLYGCLSEDTEVLTQSGWEHYHRNIKDSPILTYDIEHGTFAFDKPTHEFVYQNQHPAYRIHSDTTDQIVSRNHRCIVERDGREVFCYAEALEQQEKIPILESLCCLPDAIPNLYERTSIQKQDLLERMCKNEIVGISPAKESPHPPQDDFNNLPLRKAGVETQFAVEESQTTHMQPPLPGKVHHWDNINCQQIRQNGNEISRNGYAGGIKSCVERGCNLLQNAWKLCWGEVCTLPARILANGTERRLCDGTSPASCTITEKMSFAKRGCSSYRSRSDQQCSGKSCAIRDESRTQNIRREWASVEEIIYNGMMWCVSVPSGAFVARRRGKIFITGNSGFPKSLDVSKAIDKAAGVEREIIGRDLSAYRPNAVKAHKEGQVAALGLKPEGSGLITAPTTDAAKQWDGWGTALKPAWEPIILCRKPLEGTVAENVQKWGTGALNIDVCRIEINKTDDIYAKNPHTHGTIGEKGIYGTGYKTLYKVPPGRFPANLIHDGSDEVLALFPDTQQSKGKYVRKTGDKQFLGVMGDGRTNAPDGLNDSGSAARFFYCAKASQSERNTGLPQGTINKHPTVKPIALLRYLCKLITPPGGTVLDPFGGSGSTGIAAREERFSYICIDIDSESCEIAKKRNTQIGLV